MLSILFFALSFFAFALPVYAQSEPAKIDDIVIVIQKIISLLAPAAALAFFVMTVWAGFKFVRSRGEPKNVEQGRDILQYASIGAILVAASWLILLLVGFLTGCDVSIISFSNC